MFMCSTTLGPLGRGEGNAGKKGKSSLGRIKEWCIIYHNIYGFCGKYLYRQRNNGGFLSHKEHLYEHTHKKKYMGEGINKNKMRLTFDDKGFSLSG